MMPRLRHRRRRDRRRCVRRRATEPDPAASRLHRLRQPEVEHLDRAVGADLDVGRLQIAMDDALLVRGFERFGDLPRDRERLVERKRARCAMRSASVGPSTSSITSAVTPSTFLEPVDRARCSDDSARRGPGLRAGIARADRDRREGVAAAP